VESEEGEQEQRNREQEQTEETEKARREFFALCFLRFDLKKENL
jgi:hypothetical protein